MPSLTDDQVAALRELLGEGGRTRAEVEPLVDELQRQQENASPVNHDLAEARSLEIHRLVAERVREDPRLVRAAHRRVEAWLADGKMSTTYADSWKELLEGPLERLIELLRDPGEKAKELRQCTPFVGVIDQQTRLRIWRDVRERMAS